jgi:Protein of unknown function (DUF3027)
MRDATAVDASVVDAARAALLETTSEDSVGEVRGLTDPSEGVIDVHFENTLAGYPGWTWSVSVSTVDGTEHPSVLELGLIPGEDSLVAPEWVPWSERLADYRAAQEAKDAGELGDEAGDESDEEGEDELVEEEDLLGDEEDELDGVDFEEVAGGAGDVGEADDEDDDLEDEDDEDDLEDDDDDL